jgi:hypothetical protein
MTTNTESQEVWTLLRELVAAQKETERQLQELGRETQALGRETQALGRETQALSHETKVLSRENQTLSQQTQVLGQRIGDLTGRWGTFVENQVAPACQTVFAAWGIPVHMVSQRVKKRRDGDTLEIDVLVVNEQHAVVVEVKSNFRVEDVNLFVEDLRAFRRFFPEYRERQVLGAVAAITFEGGVDRYAYQQGLFVLAQSGGNIGILNGRAFKPKNW